MKAIQLHDTVGDIVARQPALSRVFEDSRVDYCCGGGKTVEEACGEKGIDASSLIAALEEAQSSSEGESPVDAAAMGLADLADHIVQTHHAYLRSELLRLDRITQKVSSVHGGKDDRLHQVRQTFLALAEELSAHMMKEEQILFPLIRQIEAGDAPSAFHCGSIANPIRQMEAEHDRAGSALERLHALTDSYTPPDWACNTYRAMLDGLATLERDTHQHIHKENNVLFPRALEMAGPN